jgi:hypothetical protein
MQETGPSRFQPTPDRCQYGENANVPPLRLPPSIAVFRFRRPPSTACNHFAWRCRDAEETRQFLRGSARAAARPCHQGRPRSPRPGEYCPYVHVFFEMKDGSYIAFFDLGDNEAAVPSPNTPPWVNHLALRMDSIEEVVDAKKRFGSSRRRRSSASPITAFHPLDLFLRSERHPARTDGPRNLSDKEAAEFKASAHRELDAWTKEKAERAKGAGGLTALLWRTGDGFAEPRRRFDRAARSDDKPPRMNLHQPFTLPPQSARADLTMKDGAIIRLRRYGPARRDPHRARPWQRACDQRLCAVLAAAGRTLRSRRLRHAQSRREPRCTPRRGIVWENFFSDIEEVFPGHPRAFRSGQNGLRRCIRCRRWRRSKHAWRNRGRWDAGLCVRSADVARRPVIR